MQLSSRYKVWIGVFLVLLFVGACAYIYQLINGLGVTGMSNGVSWGAYITCFMFFVGLSAGGLIVASSAHVFGIESFKKIALPAVITSTACICCAGVCIFLDLGGIQRIWRMIVGLNITSPLAWDMIVISLYLIINILDIVWLKKGEEDKVRKLSFVALPVAILVHSVTAWIFGLEIAKEGWYSAILAPIFVASALDSGLALLLTVLFGLKKADILDCGEDLFASLAKLLATFIAVDAYLIACELLTVAYPGTEAGNELLTIMTSGATAPFFWAEIIVGLLIPFCVLASKKRRCKSACVVGASICVMFGVFCKRIWLLFSSFSMANVYGAPGVSSGSSAARAEVGTESWALLGSYTPTPVELLIVIAVFSVCALLIVVLSKKLIVKK